MKKSECIFRVSEEVVKAIEDNMGYYCGDNFVADRGIYVSIEYS